MTKQEIEREISELNVRYNQEKSRLENKLYELEQLEKEKQCHSMMNKTDFYIKIMKHLLKLNDIYCNKGNGRYSCSECKFKTENNICIKNWLIVEFDEFVRQAKKEIKDEKIDSQNSQ